MEVSVIDGCLACLTWMEETRVCLLSHAWNSCLLCLNCNQNPSTTLSDKSGDIVYLSIFQLSSTLLSSTLSVLLCFVDSALIEPCDHQQQKRSSEHRVVTDQHLSLCIFTQQSSRETDSISYTIAVINHFVVIMAGQSWNCQALLQPHMICYVFILLNWSLLAALLSS